MNKKELFTDISTIGNTLGVAVNDEVLTMGKPIGYLKNIKKLK